MKTWKTMDFLHDQLINYPETDASASFSYTKEKCNNSIHV